jgi:hypothetical protein
LKGKYEKRREKREHVEEEAREKTVKRKCTALK